jgi:hypothetical protein
MVIVPSSAFRRPFDCSVWYWLASVGTIPIAPICPESAAFNLSEVANSAFVRVIAVNDGGLLTSRLAIGQSPIERLRDTWLDLAQANCLMGALQPW